MTAYCCRKLLGEDEKVRIMRHKIGIIATGAASNVGDFLRGQATIDLVRKCMPDAMITVFCSNKPSFQGTYLLEHFSEIYDGIKKRNSFQIRRSIDYYKTLLDQDVIVISEGTLHGYSRKAVIPSLAGTEILAMIPKVFGRKRKFIALGITYEPGPSPPSNFLNNILLKSCVTAVSTRDKQSYNYLRSLGISNVLLAADLTFNIDELSEGKTSIGRTDNDVLTIGMNLRPHWNESKILITIGKAIRSIFKKYQRKVRLIFFPLEHEDYIMATKLIHLLPREEIEVLSMNNEYVSMPYVRKLINNISRLDVAIGMRLHFGILSLIHKKPFIPVCYHKKVKNLAMEFGLECIDAENLSSKDPEKMYNLIMEMSYNGVDHLTKERLQFMIRRATNNLKLLKEFINS
jgi:polysaccharide pyruvyl transferase WcaK-like protein